MVSDSYIASLTPFLNSNFFSNTYIHTYSSIYDDFHIQFYTQRQQIIIELQESKEMEKLLKDKILKEKQKFSDLLVKYDDLRLSPLLSKETKVELTELQATVKEVNSRVQKVEVIQQYWNTKVTT